ncbi:hypothetical protein D6C90_00873 [Aureobasidium pullulans]|uniref:Uncharacterized protein n=1 Tax=Aureobasidium pullulans TaxID=5580 RepID=A0A4S9VL50_AURPU|nr:hypothetical protein D6C90_00873 [Aureobasidium pullulans]
MQQACCYAEIDNGGDTSYCCNGSIVGNPSSSEASALNDLTCCQDDGRTGISVGFDITTCRAGSATPPHRQRNCCINCRRRYQELECFEEYE